MWSCGLSSWSRRSGCFLRLRLRRRGVPRSLDLMAGVFALISVWDLFRGLRCLRRSSLRAVLGFRRSGRGGWSSGFVEVGCRRLVGYGMWSLDAIRGGARLSFSQTISCGAWVAVCGCGGSECGGSSIGIPGIAPERRILGRRSQLLQRRRGVVLEKDCSPRYLLGNWKED